MRLNIIIHCVLWLQFIRTMYCHLPSYKESEVNKIEAACDQAKKCIHDTIPICGRSSTGDGQKRTFWDLCDLFEYACDNEEIWKHTPDIPGCPDISR